MTNASPQRPTHRRSLAGGFTIVELLVVISIIGLLLAIVSVGITRAAETSRQTWFLSNLKQVGTAWTFYANQNEDRCMPGYMDDGVQTAFRVKVKDAAGNTVPKQFCRHYPFRLLPFLDNDRSMLYRYLADYEDVSNIPDDVVQANPCFGYNAYYVGGWYTTVNGQSRMAFSDTGYFREPGVLVPRKEVVARATSQIQSTSGQIIFSASVAAQPGFIKDPSEDAPGAPWVVPHILAEDVIWESSDGTNFQQVDVTAAYENDGIGDAIASLFGAPSRASRANGIARVQGTTGMNVLQAQAVPLRRIKNVVQTLTSDLSTQTQGLRDLMDQRKWINVAGDCVDPLKFSHPQ
jgi:prepilin-type N-terminal cleavage/methylation domain-containing protein